MVASYKICILGKKTTDDSTVQLGRITEVTHTIHFSSENKKTDADKNTYYTNTQIHIDDSIRTIKMKILQELHKGDNSNKIQLRPSYEEIYLYGFVTEKTSSLQLFDALKNDEDSNKTIPLDIIYQMLEGHPDAKTILARLPKNDQINYIDFETLLSEKQIELFAKTPLGIQFTKSKRDTTFETDPFSVDNHHAYLVEHNNMHYFDDSLLLNHGDLMENTIYVCLADRVYEYASKPSEEYIARYYFPGLYKSGIHSKETLISKRDKLIKLTQKLLTEERTQYYQSIDTFYKIAEDGNIQYIQYGIQKITIRLKNQLSHQANLEMLFKNMHCSREVPYIKFNPGNRRENLYRFYFERTTRTGKKIPYLTRSHIMRMAKETGRGQQISAYLEGTILRILSNCYVHFETDGDIQLQLTFKTPIDEKTLDTTIAEHIMPHISNIGRDIRQTGFTAPTYNGLRDIINTKIIDMEIIAKTSATKNVTWESIPCVYSICTLNSEKPGQPLVARLKRVENFKEMDAAHILIAELYGQVQYGEMGLQDIVDELVTRGLSENEESGKILIADFLATINEINGEIVEKPGFPMNMTIDSEEKTIEIRISGLTSFFYLKTVSVYIDAIIKTTQLYKETNSLTKQLKKLCKKAIKFKEVEPEQDEVPRVLKDISAFDGPLRLSNFNKREDDFFAQFESDEEDDDVVHMRPSSNIVTISKDEQEYDADNLIDQLRKNTNTISNPIQFDEEENDYNMQQKPSLSPIMETNSASRSPILFSDDEDEDDNNDSDLNANTDATKTQSPPVNHKTLSPSLSPSLSPKRVSLPTRNGPIMFDSDSDEEYGGAKKVRFASFANGLEGEDADNSEDDEHINAIEPSAFLNNNNIDADTESDEDENRLVPDGMPLKPVNPFLKKLRRKDPVLFMSKPNGKYKAFSVSCQPTSRHPVILTQEEMDRTDKSAYQHSIKYGSDPNNPHYFICPRFWCFLTNSAISEEDVKSGKCGAIIPKNAKIVPKGSYVYELNANAQIPGFIEESRSDGKCLPCCFKKTWNNKTQSDARNRCESQMRTDIEIEDVQNTKASSQKSRKPIKASQYIYSLDTYPVPTTRWGFLPIPVQLFLQMDYKSSLDPNNPAILQPNKEVFLRCGVEQHLNQSFLGCFANIYAYRQGLNTVPTVAEFRRILTETINLDVFVKAHNGSLLSAFYPKDANKRLLGKFSGETAPEFRSKNTEKQRMGVVGKMKLSSESRKKYKDTEFAIELNLTNNTSSNATLFSKKRHFDDAILAYENFIAYLLDTEVNIDHKYLWDFVCDDNKRLIPKGLNLVILEIKANDIIDRIELVCPTNLYSRHQYNAAKDTVLLLKHDEFYEPIYMYASTSTGSPKVTRFLSETKMPGSVSDILKRIDHATRKYCPGLPSLPKIYRFANPIPIQKLLGALVKIGAKIESQVVNYQGKTIGLMVQEKEKDFAIYIPCAPSARLHMPLKYMDSTSIPKEYEKTTESLYRISASAKIPCKPVWKIKENGMIVGFLTETNQFVPIKPNEDIIMDGLHAYEGVDTFDADKTVATEHTGDKTRIKLTKYIMLESQFYHAFRNRVRTLLNQFANRKWKTSIRQVSENKSLLYTQKIVQIESLVRQLIEDYVIFVDIDKSVLMDMAEVNECDDAGDEGPNCIIKENGVAQLVIPKWHLISKYDNEMIYIGRIADELIRNDRVKSIMYDNTTRLNAKTTEYQIKDDEFILVQSALTPDYFSELDSNGEPNPYATQTNYELASPSITVTYKNESIPLSEQYKEPEYGITDNAQDCLVRISKIIGNQRQVWERIFSDESREHVFRDTVKCTFQPIMQVVQSKLGESWTEQDVKNRLIFAYSKLFDSDPSNLSKIIRIMREQGKTRMFERFVKAKVDLSPDAFQDIVMSDGYYLTDMDIWVLANEYKLPIVVFNANGLKGFFTKNNDAVGGVTDINTQWIKMGGEKNDKYHFIRSKIRTAKGSYANHIYEYHLIVPAVKLTQTNEFEEMVVESTKSDRLNTAILEDALERFL